MIGILLKRKMETARNRAFLKWKVHTNNQEKGRDLIIKLVKLSESWKRLEQRKTYRAFYKWRMMESLKQQVVKLGVKIKGEGELNNENMTPNVMAAGKKIITQGIRPKS